MRGGGVAGAAGVARVVEVDGALGRSGGRRCGLNKNADYHKERNMDARKHASSTYPHLLLVTAS